MRIAVVTSSPPMAEGGHLVMARALVQALCEAGHVASTIVTPQNRFGRQGAAYLANWLTDVGTTEGEPIDRVVSLRYPSYAVRHPHHVCWLNHTMREYYDQWGRFSGGLSPQGRVKERTRRLLPLIHEQARVILPAQQGRLGEDDRVEQRTDLDEARLGDGALRHGRLAAVGSDVDLPRRGLAVHEDLEQGGAGAGRDDHDAYLPDRGVVAFDRLPVELCDVAVALHSSADAVPEQEAFRGVAGLVVPADGDVVPRALDLEAQQLAGVRVPHALVVEAVAPVLAARGAGDCCPREVPVEPERPDLLDLGGAVREEAEGLLDQRMVVGFGPGRGGDEDEQGDDEREALHDHALTFAGRTGEPPRRIRAGNHPISSRL